MVQAYAFLLIAYLYGVRMPLWEYLFAFPALVLSGLMLGALGILLSSLIRQLENFAGVMNFVIFPMFFLSSALYPLWRVREASPLLAELATWNPFTYAVEMIRFALYEQLNLEATLITLGTMLVLMLLAILGYNPARGMMARKGQAPG